MNDYWEKRQAQLDSSLEKSEDALKKRLLKVYEREAAKLDKEIATYYQKYGKDNVIDYARLFEQLSDDDIRLLIERMDEFSEKYPEYAELMPVRESVYKLNRLEGLQESVLMHQYEIGAITNEQLQKHLSSLYFTNSKAAAKAVGLSENESIVKNFVDNKWAEGKDFSQRIWQNADKLANYLNSDISQGFARGDSYERLSQQVRSRFVNVAKNDAYRLVYTEGTYVMNESQAKVFEQDFDEYEYLTAKDGKVCPVCSALSGKRFKFDQRQPNSNFPPMHPWCRCHFNPVVDDWDKWLDNYEQRHGGNGEKTLNNIVDRDKINLESTPTGFTPPKSWKLKSVKSDIISDLKNSNPHFNEGKVYQINCQKCVPTYEMRRRGYDVEAFPTYSNADIVKNRWDRVFKDAQIQCTKGNPKAEITKALLDYGDGARIQVYIEFLSGNYSHTFIAENINGHVYFLDPQTFGTAENYFDPALIKINETMYFRIDNLEPTDLIKQCCKGKG